MKYLFYFLCLFYGVNSFSQNIEAQYAMIVTYDFNKVSQANANGSVPRNFKPEPFDLYYQGYIYRSGDSTISFLKPLYFNEFPDGNIKYKVTEGDVGVFAASTDTIQSIWLIVNTDSSTRHWRSNISSPPAPTRFIIFEGPLLHNNDPSWISLHEKREIKGLMCEKMAFIYGKNKTPLYEAWVYRGITTPIGLNGEVNAPGLIVEGTKTDGPIKTIYTLTSLNMGQPPPKNVFWPDVFRQAKFIDTGSEHNKKKQEKQINSIDIMGQ